MMFTSDNGGVGYIGLPNVNRPYRAQDDRSSRRHPRPLFLKAGPHRRAAPSPTLFTTSIS
ncbi:MAG: hypothetical protein R3E53_16440 [Myxococcota bacterium]